MTAVWGSLLKRAKGGLAGEEEETLAPFHNSVRSGCRTRMRQGTFMSLRNWPVTR